MQAKTRSLMVRIDRLEAQIDRQQKRDRAARLLAARAMLNKRVPLGGVTRGRRRVTQVCVGVCVGGWVAWWLGGWLGACVVPCVLV